MNETKRRLLAHAHLLVKTNDAPTTFTELALLLDALGDLMSDLTGEVVQIRMTAIGQPEILSLEKSPRAAQH